jgi:hypothetical protein
MTLILFRLIIHKSRLSEQLKECAESNVVSIKMEYLLIFVAKICPRSFRVGVGASKSLFGRCRQSASSVSLHCKIIVHLQA